MEVQFVDVSLLGRRIDPTYYSHTALKEIKRLKTSGYNLMPLQEICKRRNSGPFGSSLLASAYVSKSSNAVIFFRPVDCKDVIANINNDNVYISSEDNKRLSSSSFHGGSIILTKIGNSIGDVSVVPEFLTTCNISGNMMGMTTDKLDPYFLVTYLKTKNGASQISRGIIGGPMPKIDMESIAEICAPVPSENIQKAIGNKVRKAERLRELALDSWQRAGRLFEGIFEIQLSPDFFTDFPKEKVRSKNYNCLSTEPPVFTSVINDEIGAQYYHPRRVHAQKIAKNLGQWDVLSFLAERQTKRKISCIATAKYLGLDSIDSVTGVINNDSSINDTATPGSFFGPLDILFSRLRPYLNKVSIWPENIGNGYGSGEFFIYKVHQEKVDPFYLFFVLKSALGLYQVIDVTSGSTHPRVDAQVVDSILIPRLEKNSEQKIAYHTRKTHQFWYEANQLIPQAKSDIEALIDGTLDEDKLLAQGKEIDQWLKDNPSPYTEREN